MPKPTQESESSMRVQTNRHVLFATPEEALEYLKDHQLELSEARGHWTNILIRHHEVEIGKIAERRAQLVQVENESRDILAAKLIPGAGKIAHQWERIKILQALSWLRGFELKELVNAIV
jgi:hypothetical protein